MGAGCFQGHTFKEKYTLETILLSSPQFTTIFEEFQILVSVVPAASPVGNFLLKRIVFNNFFFGSLRQITGIVMRGAQRVQINIALESVDVLP